MEQIKEVNELLSFIQLKKREGKTIGFVPTMGTLHAGHDSLVNKCQEENEITIVSIFVNPIQFNNQEDFINYPRNLILDVKRLKGLSCDVLFAPSIEEISKIPDPNVSLNLGNLNSILEARQRPGHFKGVINIVSKLFEIISPNKAYFGEKDLQQLLIIKKLCRQKFNNIQIISCPTIRSHEGLAQSSRNKNLNPSEVLLANSIYQALREVEKKKWKWSVKKIKDYVENYFNKITRINLDYFEIIESESFSFTQEINSNYNYYAVIAVKIRNIRLIDNLKL
tara:strand:- start:212 stop:1054 length:843 start_codon:yes stop_codon:yes gene_type:complete